MWRDLLAFVLGSAGVMADFYGVVDLFHRLPLLGALLVLAGLLAIGAAFWLSPSRDAAG